MFIRVNGRVQYLWRAVDQEGEVLDILVQSRRDKKAAERFFRKLLKGLQYVPRVIITDQREELPRGDRRGPTRSRAPAG